MRWPGRRSAVRAAPEYVPRAGRGLPDYVPLARDVRDPSGGGGYGTPGRRFNEASAPLTAHERFSLMGATGTAFFAGLISDQQYGESEPPEWSGERRWRTINQMWRRDGTVGGTVNVCLLPLLQATYSINPGSDDQRDVDIAQFVADNLLHGMRQTWHHLLRTFYLNRMRYGHFVGEKCWQVGDDGRIRLSKIPVRLPETIYRWFPNADDELDRIMQKVWVQQADGVTGTYAFPIIPKSKLLVSTRNQEGNDFRGISLLRQAWFHADIKWKLYIIDGIAAERNGLGVPWARPLDNPNGRVPQLSDMNAAAAALASFHAGEKQYMLFPPGWEWGLMAVTGQVRNIMPSIEHHDLLIPRSVLAQFLNIDSGGTLIAARDSSSFFLQAEQAESDEGNEDLNGVIRELVDLNYDAVERYPTIAVTGIENRDLDTLLRGIGSLFQQGALTANAETENALRGYLDLPDLPAAATPAGGGSPTVDAESAGETTEDVAHGVQGVGAAGDTTGLSYRSALARSGLPLGSRVTFHSGQPLAERVVHLSGQPLRKERFTLRMSGAYRDSGPVLPAGQYLSRDADGTEWVCLRRKAAGHRIPNPNTGDDYDATDATIRGFTHVLWRLGSGGTSQTHCPQCLFMARKGLLALAELHIEPGSGDTWCAESCTCELEYRRARVVKVGQGKAA